MVAQYPDNVLVRVPTESTQGTNGDWLPAGYLEYRVDGRYETQNKTDTYVTGADGRQIRVKGCIYIKLNRYDFPVGAEVVVTRGGREILTDTVKQYYRGQLNQRIWV